MSLTLEVSGFASISCLGHRRGHLDAAACRSHAAAAAVAVATAVAALQQGLRWTPERTQATLLPVCRRIAATARAMGLEVPDNHAHFLGGSFPPTAPNGATPLSAPNGAAIAPRTEPPARGVAPGGARL